MLLFFKDIAYGGAGPSVGVGVAMAVVVFGAVLRRVNRGDKYFISSSRESLS